MSYPIGVCCAQTHKLSRMDIWPVGNNLDLGMGIMYMKWWGPTPFFSRSPQYRCAGGKNRKKVCEKKGNNVGSCPFLPMTRQNLDWFPTFLPTAFLTTASPSLTLTLTQTLTITLTLTLTLTIALTRTVLTFWSEMRWSEMQRAEKGVTIWIWVWENVKKLSEKCEK